MYFQNTGVCMLCLSPRPLTALICGLGLCALSATMLGAVEAVPEAEARDAGWPSTQGPLGNRQSLPITTPLINDPTQARVLWYSSDTSMGLEKLGSRGFRSADRVERFLGPEADITPGTWASPIVADGKVLWSSWEPTGDFVTVPFGDEGDTVTYRLDSQDVVVALDMHTGEVVWKAEHPGGWQPGGGKRGGHQVTPAAADGRIFSLGSTGRLFAHSLADGSLLWQTEPHPEAQARREYGLAQLAAGNYVAPGEVPTPAVSLVVAEGVLITPAGGGRSVTLQGRDVASGSVIWELEDACHPDTTPAIWRHGGQEYLLAKNRGGTLRLIDPRDGSVRWALEGLGHSVFSLQPSERTVMVNVNPGRNSAVWGAVDLTPDAASIRWQLQLEDLEYAGPEIRGDSAGHQRALINHGRVLLGLRTGRRSERALLLDEETGAVLAALDSDDHRGSGFPHATSTIYPIGNNAYLHRHWPTGGSGSEWYLWRITPEDGFVMAAPLGIPAAIDIPSRRAYDVPNEVPIVGGVMYQRSRAGGVVAIDLRLPEGSQQWEMEWDGLLPGLPPLATRMLVQGDRLLTASHRYFDSTEAGIVYTRQRRRAFWLNMDLLDGTMSEDGFQGTLHADFDTYKAEIGVDIQRDGDAITGTWNRMIPASPNQPDTSGAIQGEAAMEQRGYPTGWLEHQPWTPIGDNPAGTTTWAMYLHSAIPHASGETRAASILFDWDGERVTRAVMGAFNFNQAWHEVDPKDLRITEDGRIEGSFTVIVQSDRWVTPGGIDALDQDSNPNGMAGTITIEGTFEGNELRGRHSSSWGMPLEMRGDIRGTVAQP
ncbi:MAG: hypothetical protein EA402_00515 [Planctomycetota bacterium]|nr:MAG: hypothetical protein EA402_00515 [Planctomycetota bacterium]